MQQGEERQGNQYVVEKGEYGTKRELPATEANQQEQEYKSKRPESRKERGVPDVISYGSTYLAGRNNVCSAGLCALEALQVNGNTRRLYSFMQLVHHAVHHITARLIDQIRSSNAERIATAYCLHNGVAAE